MAGFCANCGGANAVDARFCAQCGTSLAAECPSCGSEVAPDAQFCSSCGHKLASEPTTVEASNEERKVISVLFCDLAGFTERTERSDPEDIRSRLRTYHSTVRQDVERFGGRIEKLMGDGVFAVFGSPTAHEDDPERAVRTALRIQESITQLNADQPDLELVARAAVTTGEAIIQLDVRPDREGIIGDVVNTASRLEAVAEPGTVLVDERTFLATRAVMEFDGLDPVSVKGKVGAVAIWKALGTRSRFGVAVEEDSSGQFVGRRDELSLLVDAYERVVSRSAPGLVTIVGEPGVGKSRLIREFRQLVDDRSDVTYWRQGRCLPYGEGVTFWAIGELVKAHAGILESESPDVTIAKLDSAVGALIESPTDVAWISLRLRPLAGVAGGEGVERAELFSGWLRFFEAMAARHPMIMVVEDLHWADDAVIDFLDYLTEWATDAPILLVTTARPEVFVDRPDWGGGRRDAVIASLAPLSDQESAELLVSLTDRPVMAAEVQSALLEQAGGNPLYVTEYVRLAEERGWFEDETHGRQITLPDSIQSIISARVDLLDPADKHLLQVAAVVGRVFWTGALAYAGAMKPDEVRNGLRRLARRELVRPVRQSSMQGEDEFSFSHILIRDVGYGRLTKEERARLHEAIAQWLEAVSGDRAADVAELLAHHLVTSFDLAPSDDSDRKARIYRFLMLAAERSAAFDAARARDFADQAGRFASGDSEKGRALVALGTASIEPAERRDSFRSALTLFEQAGDLEGQARAMMFFGGEAWQRGDSAETDRIDEELLGLLPDLPESVVKAEILISRAAQRQLRGREEEAMDLVEDGIAIAQTLGDTKTYARGLVIKGSALVQLGQIDGFDDVREGLRILLDRNDAEMAMRTYNNVATYEIDTGAALTGLATIDEAIDYGTRRGLMLHVDWSQMTRCEALFPLGRWDEVVERVTELSAIPRLAGSQTLDGITAWATLVRFFRGEVSAAWAAWQDILEFAERVRDPQMVMPALTMGVTMALEAGDESASRSIAEKLVEFAPDHPVFISIGLLDVASSLIRLGMAEQLTLLVDRADKNHDSLRGELDGARALLADADGDHAGALALWAGVIERSDQRGLLFQATTARIEAARSASALGDLQQVETFLTSAEAGAKAMRATLLLDQIAAVRGDAAAASGM